MSKLFERKNILKTKQYFDKFESICKYEFVEDMDNLFLWHEKVIEDFYKIERNEFFPTFSVENDIDFELLWDKVDNVVNLCSMVFYMKKNGILVKVEVDKIKNFVREFFKQQSSYDACLMLLHPNKVVAFCDNEYDVDFLYVSDT